VFHSPPPARWTRPKGCLVIDPPRKDALGDTS
jgi:hypothetical protein